MKNHRLAHQENTETVPSKMKTNYKFFKRYQIFFPLCFFFTTQSVVSDEDNMPLSIPKVSKQNNVKKKRDALWETVHASDQKIFVNMDGGFEIGIGSFRKDGVFIPKIFKLEELKPFYKDQKNKSQISLIFNPGFRWNDRYVVDILDQFLKLGYKNVIVVGNSGNGYFLIGEKRNE